MDNQRNFIITAGRSGSTLLCAILADAGANFGMPHIAAWDPGGGTYEHPAMHRAAELYRTAWRISPVRPLAPRKWLWTLARHRAKRQLRRALPQAEFFKALNLDLTVQAASKLGYFPQIIVSFRPFLPQALSLSKMYGERYAEEQEAEYLRTYKNALMWLLLYGGCVVDYDQLSDPRCADWVTPLAAASRLPASALAAAREARVREPKLPHRPKDLAFSAATAHIEETMRSLCGKLVAPSHIALRAWDHESQRSSLMPSAGSGRGR